MVAGDDVALVGIGHAIAIGADAVALRAAGDLNSPAAIAESHRAGYIRADLAGRASVECGGNSGQLYP